VCFLWVLAISHIYSKLRIYKYGIIWNIYRTKGVSLVSVLKVKVKVTLVQALRLSTAHRGSRSIAILFHDHGTRRRWGVSGTPRPLFTPGKDQLPIVQEAGWAPGPVWTGVENLAPIGIRSPDRPSRSQLTGPQFDPRTVQPVAS
jgi:hypothetical protein